jgi:hypothetical protein
MFDDQNNSNPAQGTDPSGSIQPFGIGNNPSPAPSYGIAPTDQVITPVTPATPAPSLSPTTPVAVDSNLDSIKSQALSQLSPLVSKLDQTPEERYKTLMMMIQASDNHELISEAFTAAQSISDEKAKAEALLNIVNEINYFTQQASTSN